MEVHHPHHLSHKKNWKEYFLEFLMLFLAVFLGFLAENLRESYIERHREKEYITGLIQNLRADTADIRFVVDRNLLKSQRWQLLLKMVNTNLSQAENSFTFQERFIGGAFLPIFRPNDATLVQLKNSGNLRLINKKDVADSILNYDQDLKKIQSHNDLLTSSNDDIWSTAHTIIQGWIFADTAYLDLQSRKLLKKELPALTLNPLQLQVFYGKVARMDLILRVNRQYLIEQKEKATNLILFLESKYHL